VNTVHIPRIIYTLGEIFCTIHAPKSWKGLEGVLCEARSCNGTNIH